MIITTLTEPSGVPRRIGRLVGDFLRAAPAALADGAYPLQGEAVVARVMTYVTRPRAAALLEVHRAFIDVQMMLDGVERLQWYPAATLTTTAAYDPDRDVEFFAKPAAALLQATLARPLIAVFFPGDAHCTQVQLRAPRTVRKIVVKIHHTAWI